VVYIIDAVSHESYVGFPGREPHAAPLEALGFFSPLRWFQTYFADTVTSSTQALRVDSPDAAPHVIAETPGRRPAPVLPSPLGYVGRRSRVIMTCIADAVSYESYVEFSGRETHAAPPGASGFASPLRWFLTYFTDAVIFTATEALRVDSPGAAPHVIAETLGRRPAPVLPSPLGYVGRRSRAIDTDGESAMSSIGGHTTAEVGAIWVAREVQYTTHMQIANMSTDTHLHSLGVGNALHVSPHAIGVRG
jgi:hypothetical protein